MLFFSLFLKGQKQKISFSAFIMCSQTHWSPLMDHFKHYSNIMSITYYIILPHNTMNFRFWLVSIIYVHESLNCQVTVAFFFCRLVGKTFKTSIYDILFFCRYSKNKQAVSKSCLYLGWYKAFHKEKMIGESYEHNSVTVVKL